MKMQKKLLRMASVFFVVFLLFAGCGIATYFYVGYSFSSGSDNETSVSGSFRFNDEFDNLEMIDVGTGPSLLLCYSLTDSDSIPSFSSFSSTYIRNNNGKAVSSPQVLSYTSNEVTYTLYTFSDDTSTAMKSPYYLASATDPIDSDIAFSLTKDSNAELVFAESSGNYTLTGSSVNLRRYNGDTFSIDLDAIRNNETYFPDYSAITSSSTQLYCHVYAAMSASKGSFNNIYWTSLHHLGYITLKE